MMKILFLNPHIDAAHSALKSLQKKGVALLLPANATEAWQILQLHGTSVDLAIVHREDKGGQGEPGIEFTAKVKRDATQSDLPVIVTSEKWGDPEFAEHQRSATGANAYLKHPFDEKQLTAIIEAVMGTPIQAAAPVVPSKAPPAKGSKSAPSKKPQSKDTDTGLILEDASALFDRPERAERSDTSIRLEAPIFDMPEPSVHAKPPSLPPAMPPTAEPTLGQVDIGVADAVSESVIETSGPPPIPSGGAIALAPIGDVPMASDPAELEALLDAPASGAPGGYGEISIPTAAPEVIDEPSMDTAASRTLGVRTMSTTLPLTPAGQMPEDMEPEGDDPAMSQEMPYLFGSSARGAGPGRQEFAASMLGFSQPVGDAVVPGGAAHSPDLETLKKYLLLREQDVAALSTQLKGARDQVSAVEDVLREEKSRNVDLAHTVDEQKRKIDEFEREKTLALEGLQTEINELRFQIKAKTDKARVLESQVREATEEMERLKDRVRQDIRKIRVREKELENRLEIMKKDSEALIGARENKIIELKRRLDLLEFNMDLLQDQYSREKENSARLRERLAKAAQVVRVAGGLLDNGTSTAASAEAADDTDTRAAS